MGQTQEDFMKYDTRHWEMVELKEDDTVTLPWERPDMLFWRVFPRSCELIKVIQNGKTYLFVARG